MTFPVCLAPMVGLSHVGLRLLVRRYMPLDSRTIWPTEMLNSRRIPKERLGETAETYRDAVEDGLVPQILGNEAEPIRLSVQALNDWGAVGIDINMGCPVQKALKHNYGVALMGDPQYASDVVRMAKEASNLPVSVKLRAGPQGDPDFLVRFAEGLEEAGASWICLHPRRAEQKRRGVADWSQIKFLKERLSIPVIGNGDVQIFQDAQALLEETGCDGVMVGRALTARPWLVWQIGEALGFPAPRGRELERAPQTPEEEADEFHQAFHFLIHTMKSFFAENLGLRKLAFFARNAHPWLEFGHAWMTEVARSKSYAELSERHEAFFSSPQRMSQRTDLRY